MSTVVDEASGVPPAVTLDDEERRELLELARTAVAVATRATSPGALAETMNRLRVGERHAAAFVTLTEDFELRGCMGVLDASRPVGESVAEAATCAARTDPRFVPVSSSELGRIELEVSILGPMVRIEDPLSFRLGVDGIVVECEGRRGLLLPEVAPMVGNDREEMLRIACRKAGLRTDAWRRPDAHVYAFRTDRFGGPAVS
jgi:AmmeMemoRadiSam system protein A